MAPTPEALNSSGHLKPNLTRMSTVPLCPRDASPLAGFAAGSAELHQCRQCHGIWLRKEDLGAILLGQVESWRLPLEVGAQAVAKARHDERIIQCRCAGSPTMEVVRRKGLLIDVCLSCMAVWLDGGELDSLLEQTLWKKEQGLQRPEWLGSPLQPGELRMPPGELGSTALLGAPVELLDSLFESIADLFAGVSS